MSHGYYLHGREDKFLLDNFNVSPSYKRFNELIVVNWKAPTAGWIKVNTDGSLIGSLTSCGGIFRDHKGTYLGRFTSNLGELSIFAAELTCIILALEYAASHS